MMFVVLTGNPIVGFEVCGPFDNEVEAKRAGPIASESFGFPTWCWWVMPLTLLNSEKRRSVDEWRELVTRGAAYVTPKIDIDGCWELGGPHEERNLGLSLRLKTPASPYQHRKDSRVDAAGWPRSTAVTSTME